MNDAIVQAVRVRVGPRAYVLMYKAVRPATYVGTRYSTDPAYRALLRSDGEDVLLPSFEEADRVAQHYNDGPSEDCRSARWCEDPSDEEGWGWQVTEPIASRFHIDPDREDFHSDG